MGRATDAIELPLNGVLSPLFVERIRYVTIEQMGRKINERYGDGFTNRARKWSPNSAMSRKTSHTRAAMLEPAVRWT